MSRVRVFWKGSTPRIPDLSEGVDYTVVEDHGDGTVTVEIGHDPREGEALRVAARLAVEAKVKVDELPDEDVAVLSLLYDPWVAGEAVTAGALRSWDGTIVECLQAHTTQSDWTPDVVPALWKVHRSGSGSQQGKAPAEWVQPAGAHDAYSTGDCVTFQGKVYESLIDANVWNPTAYPAGWTLIA
jgi:hypothetical protein